jgi:hypothetical protein
MARMYNFSIQFVDISLQLGSIIQSNLISSLSPVKIALKAIFPVAILYRDFLCIFGVLFGLEQTRRLDLGT